MNHSGRHGSEQQFQRYLHEPRGIHLAVDVSELRRTETQTWIAESDAIQYVEELSAELDVQAIVAAETRTDARPMFSRSLSRLRQRGSRRALRDCSDCNPRTARNSGDNHALERGRAGEGFGAGRRRAARQGNRRNRPLGQAAHSTIGTGAGG